MKTLNTLLTAAILASAAITGTAQAGNPLSSITYEDSHNMFNTVNHLDSKSVPILSYGDDANARAVWSTEYEQYVNPADFETSNLAGIADVNQYMGKNPTASGVNSREIFIYNENAGDFQLQ